MGLIEANSAGWSGNLIKGKSAVSQAKKQIASIFVSPHHTKGLANLFCKGTDSKYSWLRGPHHCVIATLGLKHKSSHREYRNDGKGRVQIKLYLQTPAAASGCSLLTLVREEQLWPVLEVWTR